MKKLFCVILSAIILSTTMFAVSAADVSASVSATPDEAQEQTTEGYCDGFYYNVLDDGTAEITRYDGDETDLVIPDEIEGYQITSIRDNTFQSEFRKNVTIGKHINHIVDNGNQRYNFFILENIYVNKANNHFYDINGILFSKDTNEMLCYPSNNSTECLNVPEGIKKVIIGGALRKIEIPASVDTIVRDGSSNTAGNKLEQINVSSDNQTYCSLDGILYSKDMTKLLNIPNRNPIENYIIPETVTEIKCIPFSENMKSLTIHKDITQKYTYYFLSVHYYRNMENFFVSKDNPLYYSVDGILYWKDIYFYWKTQYAYPPSNKNKTFKIPDDTIMNIDDRFRLNNAEHLEKLILPKSMIGFADYSVTLLKSLKSIEVEDGNERYVSLNGVLYSKDMKTLECYPRGKVEKIFDVPNGVRTVHGMMSLVNLRNIKFPKSIKNIDSLLGYESTSSYGIYAHRCEDFTISGYTNSPAETYAKENGFTFISLGTINKLGDSNSDNKVDITDATNIQLYLAEYEIDFSENEDIASDTNGDGYITISDVTEIQRFLAELPSAMSKS